ncbi:hypothetical protein NY78_2619 [Desulfovibrio sp. TomC]|nr:hypothetical protein NY78_2619 [Desulfovibrio sp. TomC]
MAGPPLRVFVAQSYDADYIWCEHINQGLLEALAPLSPVVEFAYLDAKRQPDPESLARQTGHMVERIRQFAPDVVIAVDDPAQHYLVVPYLKDKPGPQVVFCGVNAPLANYGYPAANVSGIRERWHYRDAFALGKRILPAAKTVALIVEDSESGRYVVADLAEELAQNGPFALEVRHVDVVRTESEWRDKIKRYQDEVDILALGLYQSIRRDDGQGVVAPEALMAWTRENNRKPLLGFAGVAIRDGHLFGVLESGQEQGYLAGTMAAAIAAKGIAAGTLPVGLNDQGVVMLNLAAAARLGIDIPFEIIEAAGIVLP